MRNYNKLKEKFHNDVDGVKDELSNLNKIADEAKRVSEVARDAHIIIQDIDRQFEQATKLNKIDISFLFFATALQCVRQYLLGSFSELSDSSEREGHEKTEKAVKKDEKEYFKEKFGNTEDITKGNRFYHATLDEIIKNGVPYDVSAGTKNFSVGGCPNIGIGGSDHRYKTLGHDPLLGWVFGTANIMTSTLTNYQLSTFHVINGKTQNHANTMMMFEKVYHRSIEQPEILTASVIKQYFHIKSDISSKNGLPIPTVPVILSPETAKNLADRFSLDYLNTKTIACNIGLIAKQASVAVLINKLIAIIHGILYDAAIHGEVNLYEIKTRKILSYSNTIASVSNVIQAVFRKFILHDSKALNSLDIGGFIITLYRIISDYQFIKQVKFEFLGKEFYNTVMGNDFDF
jgi:hypothetical protein